MWKVRQARLGAAVVAVPPFVALAVVVTGLDMISIVHDLGAEWGPDGIAQGVAADPLRWQWSYLLNAASQAVSLISVLAICSYLRSAGEHLWSFLGRSTPNAESRGAHLLRWICLDPWSGERGRRLRRGDIRVPDARGSGRFLGPADRTNGNAPGIGLRFHVLWVDLPPGGDMAQPRPEPVDDLDGGPSNGCPMGNWAVGRKSGWVHTFGTSSC